MYEKINKTDYSLKKDGEKSARIAGGVTCLEAVAGRDAGG